MTQPRFAEAVGKYWQLRAAQAAKQAEAGQVDAGTRGEATGGGHLEPIVGLLEQAFIDAGIAPEAVRRSAGLELPGITARLSGGISS